MTQPPVASGSQDFSWKWFLLSAQGRITRSDYWLRYFLPYFVILIITIIFDQFAAINDGYPVLTIIFFLLSIYSTIVVQIKRWHDRDKSGWWILINLVPYIGGIWALVENGFLRGTAGPNRFGPSRFPEEQNINEVFE
ncbi:hypothetical protein WH96_18325 [Kiloniella spongiae]|uniref:DUF805 domain-containing protein n=2 Tax=Kiloniella spongiae TaxID=1489064 RepID=A0A0H2MRM6_9PROT|nr:hypothetical protein WH96_18325 [Kiloniella spongiae]